MRSGTIVALATVATLSANMLAQESEVRIKVYLDGFDSAPYRTTAMAQWMAADMLAAAGVHADWNRRLPSKGQAQREGAIVITMDPREEYRDAVAEAYPYEGVRIRIHYARLRWAEARPQLAPALLAHVMVHEITHILQGIDRHSVSGIMKPAWTIHDYEIMENYPIPFDPTDVLLIHLGNARRTGRRLSEAAISKLLAAESQEER